MSKKKKFKKFNRSQILDQIQKSEDISDNSATSQSIEPAQKITRKTNIEPTKIDAGNQNDKYIRSDLKRVACVFSIIILLLIGAVIVDKKTTWFNVVNNNITNVLHLNQ